MMIYLIGETGAARTTDEAMAATLEAASGYHRCTESEYWQKLREIGALDTEEAESERVQCDHAAACPHSCEILKKSHVRI